jgi:hypothetical protein
MKAQWVSEKVTRRCMRPTIPADCADPHGKVRALYIASMLPAPRRSPKLSRADCFRFRHARAPAPLSSRRSRSPFHHHAALTLHPSCEQWVLQKHSVEQLNRGGGVLDVAGGRGELSFQLHVRGVRATCVDRRECRPCKAMLKYPAQSDQPFLFWHDVTSSGIPSCIPAMPPAC